MGSGDYSRSPPPFHTLNSPPPLPSVHRPPPSTPDFHPTGPVRPSLSVQQVSAYEQDLVGLIATRVRLRRGQVIGLCCWLLVTVSTRTASGHRYGSTQVYSTLPYSTARYCTHSATTLIRSLLHVFALNALQQQHQAGAVGGGSSDWTAARVHLDASTSAPLPVVLYAPSTNATAGFRRCRFR
jgi:hypothetical protein